LDSSEAKLATNQEESKQLRELVARLFSTERADNEKQRSTITKYSESLKQRLRLQLDKWKLSAPQLEAEAVLEGEIQAQVDVRRSSAHLINFLFFYKMHATHSNACSIC